MAQVSVAESKTKHFLKGKNMGFFNLFRKKISKSDFIVAFLASHKISSRGLFIQYKDIFHYQDELDMLLAFKEIEYLVFWFLKRRLSEAILIEIYREFLNEKKLSYDKFREQLELRYKIYDDAYDKFVGDPQKGNNSKHGLSIGQILIKLIGDLDLLKNGVLKDQHSENINTAFLAFSIWFEGLKAVDDTIETAMRKFQIDSFLR